MKFARAVFTVAGIWGLLTIVPLFFARDLIGRQYPPPISHPDFYYGFLSVTLVWQIAFLVIGRDPVRYRPMMVVAMLEKFVYLACMGALYARGELQFVQLVVSGPDLILGCLFIAAFMAVSNAEPAAV